jgi:N-methylhydantoinase B/acetone carboxylase, alpha subunit
MGTATSARLRDLSDAEFATLYDCDRFTASVLGSRFRYIVKHMCTHLMTNAFSAILRDWYDFAATVSGPPSLGYPMCAVSDSLTLFTGVMSAATRNVVEEFGPENLRPGDILICNDPCRTGTHPNDILFARPAFHDGELIGL